MGRRVSSGWLVAAISLGVVGCASGGDVSVRGGDASRRDGGADIDSGETGVCDPPCADGEACEAGTCVPATTVDADADGLDAAIDCDDRDPSVGSSGERACAGACGDGVETCKAGVWGECSAPTSCDCEPGTPPRTIACMRCGTQRQICSGGRWVDAGACTGAGACSPGEIGTGGSCGNCGTERRTCGLDCTWGPWACEGEGVCAAGATESETEACGTCGTGSRSRTRTCQADCTWGPYGSWGACSGGGGVCTPGEIETQTQACGNCGTGTQTRTRTCDATTCDWGAWSAWSACSGGGICAPGETRYGCDRTSSGTATMCGVEICTSSCTWGSCQLAPGAQCMSGMGSTFQCCTPTRGGSGWQFCNAASCTWYPCASHSC